MTQANVSMNGPPALSRAAKEVENHSEGIEKREENVVATNRDFVPNATPGGDH